MGLPAARTQLSPQEYLELERASEQKHEYVDGEIFAMAGGTFEHSLTASNILRELGNGLAGRPCSVLTSDMRIQIPSRRRYLYPDGSVVCGRPEFEDETRDTLLNPTVVLEVLSDSTEAYDRGDKFDQFRSLRSLKEYVLASQKAPRIEVFTRQPDESWVLRVYGPGEAARLSSIEAELSVNGAYLRVFNQAG
jgi:Uma2 family endonuclease